MKSHPVTVTVRKKLKKNSFFQEMRLKKGAIKK